MEKPRYKLLGTWREIKRVDIELLRGKYVTWSRPDPITAVMFAATADGRRMLRFNARQKCVLFLVKVSPL